MFWDFLNSQYWLYITGWCNDSSETIVDRGVDSFLNPGGLAVAGEAKSAVPGSNRVKWSAKFQGKDGLRNFSVAKFIF